jgi:hypothetical protein
LTVLIIIYIDDTQCDGSLKIIFCHSLNICLPNISFYSYFSITGVGNCEMEKLENGCDTGAVALTRQFAVNSVDEGSKEHNEASILDVSHLRIFFN